MSHYYAAGDAVYRPPWDGVGQTMVAKCCDEHAAATVALALNNLERQTEVVAELEAIITASKG